ncbi:UvrD-helicase domain-containing protein, partial [bacterium]|nr:UvrD-helicase domain-containing protein [bacterium]
MKFIADFHIHSHFSIATSGLLTPEHLDRWGRIKGIRVVGTGDFTHPGWVSELKAKLDPAEPGLYRLKPALRLPVFGGPADADDGVRFMLTAEISCIYKRAGRVRKVHNVVFAPDFESVERIQSRLRSMDFNITSDGRPILGFDSRDLLELCLDASPDAFFVPAHIWTPWFSALGDKSGFDSVRDCYADLSNHIHAVETGLSSDPPMNWLCSQLDPYALISNSDAHSPEKLGREANRFDTELSYPGMLDALKNPDDGRFLGTVEFFPQEGKYHHDGHRKCGVSWTPDETERHGGICPGCGKKVTVGVLNRVHQLADRSGPEEKAGRPQFWSVIPLCEVLSEIRGTGPHSKAVQADYAALIRRHGSELNILLDAEAEDIRKTGGALLVEAIRRMREGRVSIEAGYDGEYGRIRVFGPEDRQSLSQESLFIGTAGLPGPAVRRGRKKTSEASGDRKGSAGSAKMKTRKEDAGAGSEAVSRKPSPAFSGDSGPGAAEHMGVGDEQRKAGGITLNAEQEAAADHAGGPALVLAGPGTGKTRVLTCRILRLIQDRGVPPERILAITFTNKAAEEIRGRVSADTGGPVEGKRMPSVLTFHSFGHALLRERPDRFGRDRDFRIADEDDALELLNTLSPDSKDVRRLAKILKQSEVKAGPETDDPDADSRARERQALKDRYEEALRSGNLFDFSDLLARPLQLFREDAEWARAVAGRYDHILVDEFQDVDEAQVEWMRLLAGREAGAGSPHLWAVGDPDQSIYGFRGASPDFLRRFPEEFPGTTVYRLTKSYRCPDNVLRASGMVLEKRSGSRVQGSGLEEWRCGEGCHPRIPLSGIQGGGASSKFKVQSSKQEKSSGFQVPSSGSKNENDSGSVSCPHSLSGHPGAGGESTNLHGTDERVKVRIVRNASDASEAEFISRTIEAMAGGVRFFSMDSDITSGAEEEPLGFSDFAVLCRISRQFPALEKAFRDHGIPYRRSDTEPFYRREPAKTIVKALKEVSSRFKVQSSKEEKGSGFRVSGSGVKNEMDPGGVSFPHSSSGNPGRGGESSEFKVQSSKEEKGSGLKDADRAALLSAAGKEPVCDLIGRAASALPPIAEPADRLDLELLAERSVPFGTDLPAFLTALALGSGPDWVRTGGDSVSLFTLHAAKGLEFPCVFIAGVEDGLLPYTLHGQSSCDPEEERRLLYV